MDPGSGRLPVQVLGENEALQQFFNGLDSSVAVDTSVLEEFLSNNMEPCSFMLPESPPDSSSEACSPPQIPDFHYEQPSSSMHREELQPTSWHLKGGDSAPSYPPLLTRDQLTAYVRPGTMHQQHALPTMHHQHTLPTMHQQHALPTMHQQHALPTMHHQRTHTLPTMHHQHTLPTMHHQHTLPTMHHQHTLPTMHHQHTSPTSYSHSYAPPTPPSPPPPTDTHGTPVTGNMAPPPSDVTGHGRVPNMAPPTSDCLLSSATALHPGCSKKRRRSESEDSAVDGSCCDGGRTGPVPGLGGTQMLTWEPYRSGDWSCLYDDRNQKLSPPSYHVETDKGFNYSTADESFVCQKKNHFQVSVHVGVSSEPRSVQTPGGRQEVQDFQIKVFGIKSDSPGYLVTIEQSQPDRSKKPFHPVSVRLPGGKITKVTLGRLHFSETTANNMRKKGKPNPDQRYFQMVVGLYAAVGEETFLLAALASERIIVRASNPGQFEVDGDPLWQRGGAAGDALVCHGRVGINTDSPDDALVVGGNARVMGAILQPSDRRAKHNIQEVDSEQQLKRITKMRIVEYDYRPEFACSNGIDHAHHTGVIAQEVKELLPSAVKEVGDVTCSDGEKIPNFLMVDKEQIFMENVGAVQQLSKLTDNLETRIQELEVWNQRLQKLKSLTGSIRSTMTSSSRRPQRHSSVSTTESGKSRKVQDERRSQKRSYCLQKTIFQASVFTLLATMAFCIISIGALYLLNMRDDFDLSDHSNSSILPLKTTPWATTVLPTSPPGGSTSPPGPPGPWPPDVDFCSLLYCEEVHCCPPPAGGSRESSPPVGASRESSPPAGGSRESSPPAGGSRESSPPAGGSRESSPPAGGSRMFSPPAGGSRESSVFSLTGRGREIFKRRPESSVDWKNTTIHTFMIRENQQVIDSKYCLRDECGPERFVFRVPISQFVPENMKVTLVMNSTELLVVHLCNLDESRTCSSLMDQNSLTRTRYPPNTQGEHQWTLPVAQLHQSSYHFRSAVAGQADCSTDHHYAGALFTDYHFHFYRRCSHS
ncbi:myelin regulatory factor-like protein [Cololabis saira]|uniref:myelin regulatory factor-like protein n=1 Tax=Cololabis saira TaxID=129043 RepID=UPI002AD56968|nr:myelin regulatory factor-like protein [Cololabis saira]